MLKKTRWPFAAFLLICLALSFFSVAKINASPADREAGQYLSGEEKGAISPPAKNVAIYDTLPRVIHRKGNEMVRATEKDCRECHLSQYYPGNDFVGWEATSKWKLHWWLFSLAAFVMLIGIYSSVSIWSLGKGVSLHNPVHWPAVGGALFREAVMGIRIWRQSRTRWSIFLLISICFLLLAVVFGLIVLTRFLIPLLWPSWTPPLTEIKLVLDFMADFLGGCIFIGILLALYRRIIKKEDHVETTGEDIGILLLLLGIIVTGFFLEACRLAVVAPQPEMWASFLGAMGAKVLKILDLPWVVIRFYGWIIHAILVFLFFAYLPFSKLFHVITCPVSIVATASETHYRQNL